MICVPPPGKQISLQISVPPAGKQISLVICVPLPKKHISQRAFPWDEVGFWSRKFKKSKIDIFPKGLTHGFGPKMAIFQKVFLGNIRQENVF